VFFESFHGHYPPEIPPPLNIIQTWSCPVTRQAEGAKADINLWLYANRTSQGLPPSDGKEVEVVIKEFKFDAVPGDLNKDSKCDIKDVYILGLAYGSNSTKPNWNPIADVNSDGKVDKDDLTIISIDYAYQAGS
jgi:hypothetical protein